MSRALEQIQRRLDRPAADVTSYAHYADRPADYAQNVLGVEWWDKQVEIAEALLKPPYKVLVKTGHSVGKTCLAGGLVNWWYDAFDPSMVLTTAPTQLQVQDLLWREVRIQRRGRGGFVGPRACRLESSPSHFAHGYTARDSASFQGRHDLKILFIFDECVGVEAEFWDAVMGMFNPGLHSWLCLCNPGDTSTKAYAADKSGEWTTITISSLDHPNIAAQLRGEPPPYPSAVSIAQIDLWFNDWASPVSADDLNDETDIEWPPGSGKWLRPGPIADFRVLGRWPAEGTYGVWSEALWGKTQKAQEATDWGMVEIGCDPARQGDDFTAIHVRRGPISLEHVRANGWTLDTTAGHLKRLCQKYCVLSKNDPEQIPVKFDGDGLGIGIADMAGDYNFIPVCASNRAMNVRDYPNRRSELWFNTAHLARKGKVDFTRLPKEVLKQLRTQAMQPQWKVNGEGQCQVEKKEEMKKRLGHSPDDMDAVNLAYINPPISTITGVEAQHGRREPAQESAASRRGLMGRR